jgi:hypothetical protein
MVEVCAQWREIESWRQSKCSWQLTEIEFKMYSSDYKNLKLWATALEINKRCQGKVWSEVGSEELRFQRGDG